MGADATEQSAGDAPAARAAPSRLSPTRYRMLLESMRPKQWTKNAFVLAGLIFSGRVLEVEAALLALVTFAAFCAISGAAYLVNDLHDRETDRLNPRTAGRPIARGDIGPRTAWTAVVGATVFALAAAAVANWETVAVVAGYAVLQTAYSRWLKHVLFVDVFSIATGFLLRTFAGLVCIDADISPWILLATGLLATFLALAKRRAELVTMGTETATQRPVLAHYSLALLDELMAVVTPCIVMTYALYCVLAAPSDLMLVTLPFVLYGIFRVLFLIHHDSEATEDPSVLATRDRPLLVAIVVWGVGAGLIQVLST